MTVFERPNGRWVAQVYDVRRRKMVQVGTSVHTGKRGQREALRLEAEGAVKLLSNGAGETVGSFAGRWLTDFPRSASTTMHNAERVKGFVREHGRMRMDSVRVEDAIRWAHAHPSTVSALRAMFSDARRASVTPANVFLDLGVPTAGRGRKDLEGEWLTFEDVDRLRGCSTAAPLWSQFMDAAIVVAAYTGVRPGELFALEHQDIFHDVLLVRRSANSKLRTVTGTKNGRERRVVLPAVARDVMIGLPRIEGQPLVFAAPRGGIMWQPNFAWYWHPVRAVFGRPRMAFYELRHFCATYLLELGLSDWDVALQLGHTDKGELVRSTYGHPSARLARERIRAAIEGDQELRKAVAI